MSIKRTSCRVTERVQMKKLFAMGRSVTRISNQLRVDEETVTEVIEGKWDSKEKAMALAAMEKDKNDLLGKADAEATKTAQIAGAAAAAINGQSPVIDKEALRAEIEAQIRAEIAEEKNVKVKKVNAAAAA